MATWDDVRRIALGLPQTTERTGGGNCQWHVADKLIAWERPLRRADLAALGERAPKGPVLAAWVDHLIVDAWLARAPKRLVAAYLADSRHAALGDT